MANPKESIWGAPETWTYSNMSYGLESTIAKLANADKPKCKNFGSTSYDDYQQTLFSAVQHNVITLNTPLDRSLCPCGIAPEVSPWAKLAIFNESNNLSPTPSRTIEISDANTNWFFCNRRGASNNAYYYTRDYAYSNDGGLRYQQFAPKAATSSTIYNQCLRIAPYMSYGIKSLLLSIQVRCIAHNASNPITGTFWVTLDDWKNNYPTYDICGLRFFVRNCTAINNTSLALTYNNDIVQTGGYKSGNIAVYQTIKVLNNGENVDTEFLTLSMSDKADGRTGTIFDVSPEIYNWGDGRNNRPVYPCWNYFTGQTMNIYKPSSDPVGYYFYKIPYSQDTYDKIMKIAACFGCFFTPTNKYQFAYDMLDNDLYLTVLDENGVAHGQYTHGSDNANNSLYSKSSIRDIDYDPEAPPTPVDPNTYSNTTGFNSLSSGASATIKYVLDSSNVRQLLTDLWTISHNIAGADYENYDYKILDSFLVSNPIDSIVSLKRFPFDIPHTFSSQKTNVCLGKNTGSSQGYVTHNVFNTVVFSGVPVYAKFGNSFLDYAPYTEYELYIPFCGSVKLNAGDILGHTLNCRLQIDLTTGACVAYILADDLVIETATGVVSCDLQVAGTDSATVDSAIQNAVINHIAAREGKKAATYGALSPAGAFMTIANPVKYAAGAFTSEAELTRAEYNLTHIETPVHSMGNAGGLTGWYQEFNARLIIYYPEGESIDSSAPVSSTYPKLADLTDYAHNVGFACVMNGTVSEFHGKTVGNIDTSSIVGATEEERAQIKALFAQGVWLP